METGEKKKPMTPVMLNRAVRNKKIRDLFAKWEPIYGRTAAYLKISGTGIASYSTVVKVINEQ